MTQPHTSAASAAMFDGHSDEMVTLYKEHVPSYMSDLMSAVKEDNRQQIFYGTHKMCSAMKTIGYMKVASLLERIETERPVGSTLFDLVGEIEQLVSDSLVILENR
ncbi:MAG: Hpt domain-containing protein [bacterium]